MTDTTVELVPYPGTALLMTMPGPAPGLFPTPRRAPAAPPPNDPRPAPAHRAARGRRALAARLVTVVAHVIFGLRSPKTIAAREFSRQVRLHAAAGRATRKPTTRVRVLSLHLRPRPLTVGGRTAPDSAAPAEIFGSLQAGDAHVAFVGRLDGAQLSVLRLL